MRAFKGLWIAIALFAVLGLAGCDQDDQDRAERARGAAERTLEQAETPVRALEEATGRSLPPAAVDRGVQASEVAQTVGTIAQTGAQALGYGHVAGVIGAVVGIVGALGRFLEKRKRERVTRAAVQAAEQTETGGTVLSETAKRQGVADVVHSEYQRQLAAGEAEPSAGGE